LDGGRWLERYAGLADLPYFTRVDVDAPPAAAEAASDDKQLDTVADGLEEINVS